MRRNLKVRSNGPLHPHNPLLATIQLSRKAMKRQITVSRSGVAVRNRTVIPIVGVTLPLRGRLPILADTTATRTTISRPLRGTLFSGRASTHVSS